MAQLLTPNYERVSCYSCDRPTFHEIRYITEPSFTGKLLVCRECGETIKEPVGGRLDGGCCD